MDLGKSIFRNRSKRKPSSSLLLRNQISCFWCDLTCQDRPLLRFRFLFPLCSAVLTHSHHLWSGVLALASTVIHSACPSRVSLLPCLYHKDLPDHSSPPHLFSLDSHCICCSTWFRYGMFSNNFALIYIFRTIVSSNSSDNILSTTRC